MTEVVNTDEAHNVAQGSANFPFALFRVQLILQAVNGLMDLKYFPVNI